jgi:hypothetical protein
MSTAIATAGSVAVTDLTTDMPGLELVATDPDQMRAAQQQLVAWYRGKLQTVRGELTDADNNYSTARINGFKADSFRRALNKAKLRVEFYEKCLKAVEAGYVIVPDFPIDVFAVRTMEDKPESFREITAWRRSAGHWRVTSESPPAGEGKYVGSVTVDKVRKVDVKHEKTGELEKKFEAEAVAFAEVDFPIALAQPTMLNATHAAMAMKVFDEIGCLPARRAADPIITGRIYFPGGKPNDRRAVAFMIAWWIDTRQL